MKIIFLRITSAVLLVLLMLSIFMMSGETAQESSETSRGFTYTLFSIFLPSFLEKSEAEQNKMLSNASFWIRKGAHFSLYFAMGVLSLLTVISYRKLNLYLRLVISFLICVLYSASDEIHQLFVEGRGGQITDVLIDSTGALLGVLLCFAIILIICKKHKIGLKIP